MPAVQSAAEEALRPLLDAVVEADDRLPFGKIDPHDRDTWNAYSTLQMAQADALDKALELLAVTLHPQTGRA